MRGCEKFSLRDIVEFEAVVTMEFSEMYGLPIASVCDLFLEHGVYGYLEDEMDLLVTKNARFISENVTEVFGFQLEKVQPSESRKVPPPTPSTGERSKVEHSEVKMMSVGHTYVSPYEAAADVAILIKDRIDVPEEQARVMLLRSDIFRMILEDQHTAQMPPDELYALFAKEVEK